MTRWKFLRAFMSCLLCVCLSALPAISRDVCFDSENSNPALHSQLRPYCISARKQVEEVWDKVDPRTGGEVQLIFVVGADGGLLNVFPRTLQPNPLNERAVYAVTQCGQLPPLPDGQGTLVILATFKSKKPLLSKELSPGTKEFVKDAVICAALIGLTGLAIYGLLKLDQKYPGTVAGMNSGYTNPNYHWVNSYYRSDGVYVPGHYQTNADNTMFNNWSSAGNVNPFTGRPGYIVPRY